MNPVFELAKLVAFQPSSPSLIGKGCVCKTVGDYPVAAFYGRFDDLFEMFFPGGEHQKRFRFRMHVFMKEQFSQFLAQSGSTGFTGDDHLAVFCFQKRCDIVDMGRFAGTVNALECDETAGIGMGSA